jgi:hypothetical protein
MSYDDAIAAAEKVKRANAYLESIVREAADMIEEAYIRRENAIEDAKEFGVTVHCYNGTCFCNKAGNVLQPCVQVKVVI